MFGLGGLWLETLDLWGFCGVKMDEDGHKENDLIFHRDSALMGQDCFFRQGLVVAMWFFSLVYT